MPLAKLMRVSAEAVPAKGIGAANKAASAAVRFIMLRSRANCWPKVLALGQLFTLFHRRRELAWTAVVVAAVVVVPAMIVIHIVVWAVVTAIVADIVVGSVV